MGPEATSPADSIVRVFSDPAAVWTVDEVAGRFGLSIGQAIRALSDLEAVGLIQRDGDEYTPVATSRR